MTPERLREIIDDCHNRSDLRGCWTAELHLAEKLPPRERFIHDLGIDTFGHLNLMDRDGGLPYPGWTYRNLPGVMALVRRAVGIIFPGDDFPSLTPDESRALADEVGATLAAAVKEDPSEVERLRASLEVDRGDWRDEFRRWRSGRRRAGRGRRHPRF
jgi:hypothetical protein